MGFTAHFFVCGEFACLLSKLAYDYRRNHPGNMEHTIYGKLIV